MSTIFLHIPRTAGTTLSHILKQKYPTTKVSSSTLPDKLPTECVYGHFKYDGREAKWITFLREPYSRLRSLYNHMKTIDPFLQHDTFFKIIQPNPMCNQLGGINSEMALENLSQFYFVGKFIKDIPKFWDLIGVEPVLRHSNKSKTQHDLVIPEGFLAEDVVLFNTWFN